MRGCGNRYYQVSECFQRGILSQNMTEGERKTQGKETLREREGRKEGSPALATRTSLRSQAREGETATNKVNRAQKAAHCRNSHPVRGKKLRKDS